MNYLLRLLFTVVLIAGSLFSCSSDEVIEKSISTHQNISSDLMNKILETAISVNDFNLINKDCIEPIIVGHFINKEGNYYGPFIIPMINWEMNYMASKLEAINMTLVKFTDDDFVIDFFYTDLQQGGFAINKREDYIRYFEGCSFQEFNDDVVKVTLDLTDINFSCSGEAYYYLELGHFDYSNLTEHPISLAEGVVAVEQALSSYNQTNGTSFTPIDVKLLALRIESSDNGVSYLSGTSQLIDYFGDCKLNPIYYSDCINFVYPFNINKINLQTDDIVSITLTDDNHLIQEFFGGNGNFTIDYPITLLTVNGNNIILNSNSELEETLTAPSRFCNNHND